MPESGSDSNESIEKLEPIPRKRGLGVCHASASLL